MALPVTESKRKIAALVQLGIARQAPPDEATQRVYLIGLEHEPAEIVEAACQHWHRHARLDFEPAFPALPMILERCRIERTNRATTDTSRQLAAARATRPEPLSHEEAVVFRRDIERRVAALRSQRVVPADDARHSLRTPSCGATSFSG